MGGRGERSPGNLVRDPASIYQAENRRNTQSQPLSYTYTYTHTHMNANVHTHTQKKLISGLSLVPVNYIRPWGILQRPQVVNFDLLAPSQLQFVTLAEGSSQITLQDLSTPGTSWDTPGILFPSPLSASLPTPPRKATGPPGQQENSFQQSLPSEVDFSQVELSLSSQSGLTESELSSLCVPCIRSVKPATTSQGKM